jgi:hypothetical protein
MRAGGHQNIKFAGFCYMSHMSHLYRHLTAAAGRSSMLHGACSRRAQTWTIKYRVTLCVSKYWSRRVNY